MMDVLTMHKKDYSIGEWVICRDKICRIVGYGENIGSYMLMVENRGDEFQAFKEEFEDKL